MTSREIGNIGEDAVCNFLIKNGYEILDRNFTVRGGEIDIIAKKNEIIAFVEVKTRSEGALQTGEEAITDEKKRHLMFAAQQYFYRLDEPLNCRFDVAVAEVCNKKIKHLKYYVSAFDVSD